jgi:hypothetical protein
MFVIIGISSARKRWPLGSPTTSLDEAKCIAEKFLKMIKSKGAASFIKWNLSIKLGHCFRAAEQIILILGHWIIQEFCTRRKTRSRVDVYAHPPMPGRHIRG